jgi:hypothetical protein
MPVRVMHVRRVRMGMFYRAVRVDVGMRLPRWLLRPMHMLMVRVVDMRMFVVHRLVNMRVLVMLGSV